MKNEKRYLTWFYDNFTEDRSEIDRIMRETCIQHTCTTQELYEACKELKHDPDKTSLQEMANHLTAMMDRGVEAAKAGGLLRNFLKGRQGARERVKQILQE